MAQICDAMAREGFDPEIRRRRGGVDIVLHNCPFESSALADPDTVCQLHLGLAQGMAASSGGVTVDRLVIGDPRRAQCRLKLVIDEESATEPPSPDDGFL